MHGVEKIVGNTEFFPFLRFPVQPFARPPMNIPTKGVIKSKSKRIIIQTNTNYKYFYGIMIASRLDIDSLLEECMAGHDHEATRDELSKILSNAQGRYGQCPSFVDDDEEEDDFSWDFDSDDDDDESILADMEELMEGNAKGDLALLKTAKQTKHLSSDDKLQDETECTVSSIADDEWTSDWSNERMNKNEQMNFISSAQSIFFVAPSNQ